MFQAAHAAGPLEVTPRNLPGLPPHALLIQARDFTPKLLSIVCRVCMFSVGKSVDGVCPNRIAASPKCRVGLLVGHFSFLPI